MKSLIPMDEFGIFASAKYEAMVDSRFVADIFEKQHKDVLKAIRNILEKSGFSSDFNQRNFTPIKYIDEQNRKQPCYAMTKIRRSL